VIGQGDYTVIYRLTPEYCPMVYDTVEFTVYPPLSLMPLSADTVCYFETIELNAIVEGGYPENTLTYVWSNGGPNAAINTQLYTETTVVTLTVDDGCSEPVAQSVEILVYPSYNYTAQTSAIDCPNQPGNIQLIFGTNDSYQISWNGVPGGNSYNGQVGDVVALTIIDSNLCERDTVISIPVHPAFSFTATLPETLCMGETGTIDLTIVPAGPYTIVWNGVSTEDTSKVFSAGSEVTVLVVDEFGCEQDASWVLEAFPSFSYELTNESVVCPGEPAVVEIDYNPTGNYTVLWNGISGNPNIYNTEAGSSLSIVISDVNGCEKDTSLTISSFPPFFISVAPPDPAIDCPGVPATVTLEVFPPPLNAYTVEWNGVESNQSSLLTEHGSEVSIEVTDVNGCVNDTIFAVEAFPEPVASFTIDQVGTCIPFEDMGSITFINNSVNGESGYWFFGDNSLPAAFSPGNDVVHGYNTAGTYTIILEIISSDSCIASASQQICTLPEEPIFIPDIFSPNDDGRNDTLYVRGKFVSRLEFRVYNRWGEVVFETTSVSQGWDGKVRGVPAQSGSYYYTITATVGSATRVEEVGEIVLIR